MEQEHIKKIDQSTTSATTRRRKKIGKIGEGIKKLPDKKPHLDFIAAVLTIPLLIITLYLNINNLRNKSASSTPMPTPSVSAHTTAPASTITRIVITATPQPTANTNTCVKDIGPIDITSPQEGETVSDNPVCIDINYQAGNYCSVVWSYRINNTDWSDYSNNSVCLYNLPSGNNTFELRVKSLSSASTKTLHRTFMYKTSSSITPTPSTSITSAPTPTL